MLRKIQVHITDMCAFSDWTLEMLNFSVVSERKLKNSVANRRTFINVTAKLSSYNSSLKAC